MSTRGGGIDSPEKSSAAAGTTTNMPDPGDSGKQHRGQRRKDSVPMTTENVADRARADLIADLDLLRSKLLYDAGSARRSAADHDVQAEKNRETARFKRAKAAVVDEAIERLQHPATGVTIEVGGDVDGQALCEVLNDYTHRALQGGAR